MWDQKKGQERGHLQAEWRMVLDLAPLRLQRQVQGQVVAGDCHQLRSSPAPSSPLCPAGSFPPTFLPTALGLGQLPQTPMGNLGHSPEALGS